MLCGLHGLMGKEIGLASVQFELQQRNRLAGQIEFDDGRAVLVGGGSSFAVADVSGEGSSALVRLGDGAIPKRAEMC